MSVLIELQSKFDEKNIAVTYKFEIDEENELYDEYSEISEIGDISEIARVWHCGEIKSISKKQIVSFKKILNYGSNLDS